MLPISPLPCLHCASPCIARIGADYCIRCGVAWWHEGPAVVDEGREVPDALRALLEGFDASLEVVAVSD